MSFFQRSSIAALVVCFTASIAINAEAAKRKDIVDTAVEAGSFKTLAAALTAGDLVDTLKGEGPFTVFAPTDEAFAKLPKGTVESLLKPENKQQLVDILTYHVVPGKVLAKKVVKLDGANTVNGQRVTIAVNDGKVRVDSANVVATDIKCSNGVIHVIDAVLLPSSDDIVETASSAKSFTTLLAAAKAAGLVEALTGGGPLTVFAPTDEAFGKLPKETLASLLKPENKSKLAAILTYHVVSGRVYAADALAAKTATTLQGEDVSITLSDGQAKVNGANIIKTDIDASNGVIHVIDAVILPPERKKVSAREARAIIEHAVHRGTRAFNAGHHGECASIYTATLRELVEQGDELPAELVSHMKQVLTSSEDTSCNTGRAWKLRHGLNAAYYRMASFK